MTNNPLAKALRELARLEAELKPSDAVETVLLRAVRVRGRRRTAWAALGGLAAAAAMLALVLWPATGTDEPAVVEAEPVSRKYATELVPLDHGMPTPGLLTVGRLTRVTLPPSAPAELGFPIPPHTLPEGVEAELLLSEDGTPQAVRFLLPED